MDTTTILMIIAALCSSNYHATTPSQKKAQEGYIERAKHRTKKHSRNQNCRGLRSRYGTRQK